MSAFWDEDTGGNYVAGMFLLGCRLGCGRQCKRSRHELGCGEGGRIILI